MNTGLPSLLRSDLEQQEVIVTCILYITVSVKHMKAGKNSCLTLQNRLLQGAAK